MMDEYIKNRTKQTKIGLFLIIGLFSLTSAFFAPYLVAFLLLFLGVFFLSLKTKYGLFLVALFLPAINWLYELKYDFGVGNLIIPYVDILAIFVFVSFVFRKFYLYFTKKKTEPISFPRLFPFFIFFIFAVLSSLNSNFVFSSLWFDIRYFAFFYLVYLVAPFNIIKNEKILKYVILAIVISGFLVSVMGVVSLFQQNWYYDFVRAKPISLFGIYVLGDNQNLIAEVLLASSFFTLALKYFSSKKRFHRLINIVFWFQLLVLLATFSRGAWIVLFLQLFIYFDFRKEVKRLIIPVIISVLILSPFGYQMINLFLRGIASESNESRLLLSQIAVESFLEKPILGHGGGSFLGIVENNILFIARHGAAIDSHGIWQKILAEQGACGVITFGLFVFLIFFSMKNFLMSSGREKIKLELILPLALGSFGVFAFQFVNTSYYQGKVWLPIAVTLAAINIFNKKYEE
jgi:O-antigen ligase